MDNFSGLVAGLEGEGRDHGVRDDHYARSECRDRKAKRHVSKIGSDDDGVEKKEKGDPSCGM